MSESFSVRVSVCGLPPRALRRCSQHTGDRLQLKARCRLLVRATCRGLPPTQERARTNAVSPELVRLRCPVRVQIAAGEVLPQIGCSRAGLRRDRACILCPRGFFCSRFLPLLFLVPSQGVHDICTGRVVRVRDLLCKKQHSC